MNKQPVNKTLFEKIADREIPADFLYEDAQCFAIRDINPQAPEHVLIIPKRAIARMAQVREADGPLLGHLLVVAAKLAEELELEGGFRIVINSGKDAGETVPHLHVHLLGGRELDWPPG